MDEYLNKIWEISQFKQSTKANMAYNEVKGYFNKSKHIWKIG